MKKFLYLLILIGLLWLVKLSYDSYVFSAQLTSMQDELHKSEQTIANLNDQLVATQRDVTASPEQKNTALAGLKKEPKEVLGLNPTELLKQKLDLIQFALEQNQFVYAAEQLNVLEQMIDRYDLADTLKQTLHQAVLQDKKMIQQFVTTRSVKLSQLDDILQQLDQSIQSELNQENLTVGTPKQAHFWQKWFKVDHVESNHSALANRKIILKEVQLRLLLAQQALMRGSYIEYQSMLNSALTELSPLPDQYIRVIQQKILKLKQVQLNPTPKLSSTEILE